MNNLLVYFATVGLRGVALSKVRWRYQKHRPRTNQNRFSHPEQTRTTLVILNLIKHKLKLVKILVKILTDKIQEK